MKTLDPALFKFEMERMVCRYKNGIQAKSPAVFAMDYIDKLITGLVGDVNIRIRNVSSVRIQRHELPYPFDRFTLPAVLSHGTQTIELEEATISQVAAYLYDSFDGSILIEALEDLERSAMRVGFSVSVEQVGLLLGLVTRTQQIAPSIKLTNKNGRVVCKLKNPDIRTIKTVLPHLCAISKATGRAGIAAPFAQFITRVATLESGHTLCPMGSVSIEVFKKHINVYFESEVFDALHLFLKTHQQEDYRTRAVELAA